MPTNVYISFAEGKGITTTEPPPEEKQLVQTPTEVSSIKPEHIGLPEKKEEQHFDDEKRLLLKNDGWSDQDIKDMEKREFANN